MYLPQSDPNSIDDKDLMGVCIGPEDIYIGLDNWETKEVQFEEYDSVCYEFRKFVRLLIKSNPNVLSMLWLAPEHYIYKNWVGDLLIHNRNLFVSKQIYKAYTGYAYSQLKKMEAFNKEGYMGEKRKQLVEKYGYDTKNAAHLIRLLRMGTEFLNTGELVVLRYDAPQLLDIKRGLWTLDQVKKEAEYEFKRADAAFDRSVLPNTPDIKGIKVLVKVAIRAYIKGMDQDVYVDRSYTDGGNRGRKTHT
jgi:predicted nucleotidyltransferase